MRGPGARVISGAAGPAHRPSGSLAWRFAALTALGLLFMRDRALITPPCGIVSSAGRDGWDRRVIVVPSDRGTGQCLRAAAQAPADVGGAEDEPARDPLAKVQAKRLAARGGGVYLGLRPVGVRHGSRRERAGFCCCWGRPRSGKTSGGDHPQPCWRTPARSYPPPPSPTSPERPTALRAAMGRVWVFDPDRLRPAQDGEVLRWSPVEPHRYLGRGAVDRTRDDRRTSVPAPPIGSHWASPRPSLACTDAACRRDPPTGTMETVVDWVMRHELDEAGHAAGGSSACSRLAFGSCSGLLHTEDAGALLDLLRRRRRRCTPTPARHALDAAADPNFDPAEFVAQPRHRVTSTRPAERAGRAAPIVCGLSGGDPPRHLPRPRHRAELRAGRVLFALDEVANIAPLEELPQIASEGGGQGLAAARRPPGPLPSPARWGAAADGFLTLFGDKLLLPGIADTRTLEAVSVTLGEYDRRSRRSDRQRGSGTLFASAAQRTRTVSTQRTRVLSPGEIANIPQGQALHLDGVRWEAHRPHPGARTEPWRTLTAAPRPMTRLAEAGGPAERLDAPFRATGHLRTSWPSAPQVRGVYACHRAAATVEGAGASEC